MNFSAFITSYWHNEEEAKAKGPALRAWAKRMDLYFAPNYFFLACGTLSDPEFNPLPIAVVVNSGVKFTKPYNVVDWQYSLCAFTAAMWHASQLYDWDLLITLDQDMLVGAVNFDSLLREFMLRPEILLSTRWNNWIDFGFSAWKRDAVVKFLHQRKRPNLAEPGEDVSFPELEFERIFKGVAWTPWHHYPSCRQDYGYRPDVPSDEEAMKWPFVRFPSPTLRDRYLAENTAKAVPFNHNR